MRSELCPSLWVGKLSDLKLIFDLDLAVHTRTLINMSKPEGRALLTAMHSDPCLY